MPRFRNIQQRFTRGELDPLVIGRTDLDAYFAGAETMTNVLCIPQGGFKRRPGLEYIDTLHETVSRETSPTISAPNGGTTANANDDDTGTELVTTTGISTTDPYVVVKYDLGSAKNVAFVDVVGARMDSGANPDEFFIQTSTDDASWTTQGTAIDMTTSDITERRRVSASVRYIRFARVGTTDEGSSVVHLDEMHVWTEDGTLSSARLVGFAFNTEQTYMMLFTDKNMAVYKDGSHQVDVRTVDFTSARLSSMNWTQSADTLILVHEDVAPVKITRGDNDDDWTVTTISFDSIPQFDFVPSSSNPAGNITPGGTTGTINISGASTSFTASDVNQFIEGNGGKAKILKVNSATDIEAVVVIDFFNTNTINNPDWTLNSGFEDVWSSTRGYPRSVSFHEGRLYFGGSKSRPQTLWGSRVGDFFDFDTGQFLDDDALDVTMDTDQVNAITNIYSRDTLYIFTTGGEFTIEKSLNDPITPANINIQRQSNVGSKQNIPVFEVDSGVIYLQRGGKSLKEFTFSDVEQTFINADISLLSSHLVSDPVDMGFRKSTNTEEANYILLVNDTGNLATVCILRRQEVIGFTECTTDGTFLNTGVDDQDMYFVIERTINGATVRYIERFNNDHFMDASTRTTVSTDTTVFGSLDHLEAETVKVRADGALLDDETVSSGSITIERAASSYMEAGINFTPTVKDVPVVNPQIGSTTGLKKRVSKVTLRLDSTAHIEINGNAIQFRSFGPSGSGSPLDSSPPEFTGVKRIFGLKGWDLFGQVTITQTDPMPMTVLSVEKRVNI